MRDWSFFLVLLVDEMRRSLNFITLDPSYLDCLRAYKRKLYCCVVIYNKSTLSANLVSRVVRVSRDQQLKDITAKPVKDEVQVLQLILMYAVKHRLIGSN